MATQKQYKALQRQVNELVSTAKNTVKVKKAKALVEDFLNDHLLKINEYVDKGIYTNRLNGMHDLEYSLEFLIDELDRCIRRKNWTAIDHYNWNQYNSWID